MKKRLAVLKYFKPSIVLLILAILITLFAHPHSIVPIILVIGATVMGWQNYKILKVRSIEVSNEQKITTNLGGTIK